MVPRPPVDTRFLPSLQARLGERAAATRRAILRRAGLVALAVAVMVALGWGAFFSSLLALDPTRISVEAPAGTVDLTAVQELAAAQAGTPLPRLGTGALADSIEQVAGVRTATVTRDWPRGLAITVEPRVAAAAVPTEGGFTLVDGEGVDLGVVGTAPAGIPVLDIPLDENTPRTLGATLAILASLPDELRAEVSGVAARNADQVVLTLNGAIVRWGGDSENELKASVLATLRQIPAAVYDVSTPRRPITE